MLPTAIRFSKLEALGNDFMLIDARTYPCEPSRDQIRTLADRRYGIGFDQLLLLKPSDDNGHDLRVDIFNADASQAEQCGNGLRALALWLDRRDQLGESTTILTLAGVSKLRYTDNGQYAADLPGLRFDEIPASLDLPHGTLDVQFIRLGNPHLVLQWPQPPSPEDLHSVVEQIEAQPGWHNHCNISLAFVRLVDSAASIDLRVHERGAGPTPACGSAACATAAMMIQRGLVESPASVIQPGGAVVVNYSVDRNSTELIGPAREIYEGRIA
ncbi:MAG: diaminopimelate epimerase [Pseudomonadota bacterium]